MTERAIFRLQDMKESISEIHGLLAGHDFQIMYTNKIIRAAFERFLEILSEGPLEVAVDAMLAKYRPDIHGSS